MSDIRLSMLNSAISGFYTNPSVRRSIVGDKIADEFDKFMAKEISKSELSKEAFEEYVYEKITSFEINPAQKYVTYNINISDETLAKMQKDSNFENMIYSQIKSIFANDELKSKGIMHVKFTGEDGKCEMRFEKLKEIPKKDDEEDDFWTKRAKRQREIDKIVFERNKKKKIRDKIIRNDIIENANLRNYTFAVRTAKAYEEKTGRKGKVDFTPEMKELLGLDELLAGLSD